MTETDREIDEAASAVWTLFDGRRDCYGKGRGLCVKQAVTKELIARHLAGEIAIGVYPLTPDGLCHWVCTDLDYPGESELARWARALVLAESYRRLGCCPFIERSKSKGYHIWVFFRDPVEAAWARRLTYRALADAGLPADTEVFPKQDRLDSETRFGNYVNLPYCGQNGDGRRVMLDPATGKPWTVNEFLDALSLTDANDVLLAHDADDDGDVLVAGGSGDAARLLGEDAPYRTRHEKGKRVIGLLALRLWPDGQEAVLDAALNWNAARCQPPLPEPEVRRMVADFWRKEEAKRAKEGTEEKEKAKAIPFHTAREIAQETPESVDWLAPPWVAASAITEVTGKAKASGKTTWIMHMVAACLDGGEFLGQQTAETPVVYLTEERPATLREALARAGLLARDDLFFMYWHDTQGVAWPDVVAAAAAKCQQVGARLLVVDTLSQFARLKGDDESAAGAALAALGPLQAAAKGLGTLESRHERKGGGEVGESGRGSSAFAGAADVVLKLSRAEGAARPTIRKIEALSRFTETPENLVIELVDSFCLSVNLKVVEPNETKRPSSHYVALGTETAVALASAKQAVLDILPLSEAEALDRTEIEAQLPDTVKAHALTNALRELRDSGEAYYIGEGKKGNPYRYWKKGLYLPNKTEGAGADIK
jgi:hypothetical protein